MEDWMHFERSGKSKFNSHRVDDEKLQRDPNNGETVSWSQFLEGYFWMTAILNDLGDTLEQKNSVGQPGAGLFPRGEAWWHEHSSRSSNGCDVAQMGLQSFPPGLGTKVVDIQENTQR